MLALTGQNLSARDLGRVVAAVYEYCGINLREGKQELVQARLAKFLRQSRFRNATECLDYVLGHRESPEFAALIDALSTNLTSFFREGDHFAYLAGSFLPELMARRTAAPAIRGWCAACSTGEEPYTIAVVLQDFIASSGRTLAARVLATDISHRVLACAREGRYDRRCIHPVPPQYRCYFAPCSRDPRLVEPAPEIRRIVSFAHLNLMDSWPFTGPLDFIFCRNVMIYFDKPTQQRLISRFFDILAPRGLLFTGHSESLTGISHRFDYVRPTIYVKS